MKFSPLAISHINQAMSDLIKKPLPLNLVTHTRHANVRSPKSPISLSIASDTNIVFKQNSPCVAVIRAYRPSSFDRCQHATILGTCRSRTNGVPRARTVRYAGTYKIIIPPAFPSEVFSGSMAWSGARRRNESHHTPFRGLSDAQTQ